MDHEASSTQDAHAQRNHIGPVDVNGGVHTAHKQYQRICVRICTGASSVDWALRFELEARAAVFAEGLIVVVSWRCSCVAGIGDTLSFNPGYRPGTALRHKMLRYYIDYHPPNIYCTKSPLIPAISRPSPPHHSARSAVLAQDAQVSPPPSQVQGLKNRFQAALVCKRSSFSESPHHLCRCHVVVVVIVVVFIIVVIVVIVMDSTRPPPPPT